MLLLEYGEYFFEDLSANLNENAQGRLKICSRSVIFEPIDQKRPVVKYPFKHFASKIRIVEESIVFDSTCAFELKANNKIGPYKQIGNINPSVSGHKGSGSSGADGEDSLLGNLGEISNSDKYTGMSTATEPIRVTFHLLHSDTRDIARKMEKIRSIHAEVEKRGTGSGAAEELLAPLIKTATNFSFDTSQLVDFHEKFLLKDAIMLKRIKPLIVNPGLLMVTEARVYFQPAQLNNVGDTMQCIDLSKVSQLYRRRYLLRQTGLEFLMTDGSSALFAFDSSRERDKIYSILTSLEVKAVDASYSPTKGNVGMGANNNKASEGFKSGPSLEIITRQWQRREMSNFDYLLLLNIEADRSVNDLTQYPVFPHVITDYTSSKLDFEDPSMYRDLSKPIGALNPTRLKYFQKRYRTMPEESAEMGIPPPFLYGTHYSTPGYVLYYLVRVAPEYMLCLQNGKFDATDRMFHSMRETWESSLSNPTDLKELIPEFFCGNGDFLNNIDDLELGRRHTGDRLDNVELPPWAKRPQDFVRKMRKALESEYVSNNLHNWIDLVFGYKQKGQAAVDANNLYYYLTYEGSVDLEREKDIRQRAALEAQIQEFGQTPKQLFAAPHPCRNDLDSPLILVTSTSSSTNGSNNSSNALPNGSGSVKVSVGGSVSVSINNSNDSSNSNNANELSLAYHAGADSPLPAPPSSSSTGGSDGESNGDIRIPGKDLHQELNNEVNSMSTIGNGNGNGSGNGNGNGNGSPGHGDVHKGDMDSSGNGSDEEVHSPAMRVASSILGTIKGRTASVFENFEKSGWFGSSSGSSGDGNGDGDKSLPSSPSKQERITNNNYKSRLSSSQPSSSLQSTVEDRNGTGASGSKTSGGSRGLSFRTLQPVDMARVHEGSISSLFLGFFPLEEGGKTDNGGEWRLCSTGAKDGKLKIMRLGRKTLSITPFAEGSLPASAQQTCLVSLNKTGDGVLVLSCGEGSLANMTTYLLSSLSGGAKGGATTTCERVASQALLAGESTTVTRASLAAGAKGLIDFRATAADGSEKISKSFYVLFGNDEGSVSIRSVSHAGVLGPPASTSFVFKSSLTGRVTSTALNLDRVLLAIGLDSGAMVVIDVETRKERYVFRGETGHEVVGIVWLLRDRVAFVSGSGEVVIGDLSSNALASSAFGFRNANVTLKTSARFTCMACPRTLSLAAAPQQEDVLILCGCADGSIKAFALRGTEISEAGNFPSVHEGSITNLTCGQDLLASSGVDGTVRIWKF